MEQDEKYEKTENKKYDNDHEKRKKDGMLTIFMTDNSNIFKFYLTEVVPRLLIAVNQEFERDGQQCEKHKLLKLNFIINSFTIILSQS